jgi:transcriptional regulator with XRE-family HTH domain
VPHGESPTVGRLILGIRLRELRQREGVSAEDAAEHITRATSAISRFETGQTAVPGTVLSKLLKLYNATEEEREALTTLGKRAKSRGWWHRYGDVLPAGFDTFVGLEAEAMELRNYECQVVPGLLQTEGYAGAVMRAEPRPATEDEIARRVEARMARQKILADDDPAHLYAVLDEAVLHRPMGGQKVMKEQLDRLIEEASRRNITLQVLPYDVGAHAAMFGAFWILTIDLGEPLPYDYAYVEHRAGSLLLDKLQETDQFRTAFDELRAEALNQEQSISLIKTVARELE